MPFLSIIVPVYNKVDYIDECVTSILNQTFKDFELFLVDDGSTDGSGLRCDSFRRLDSRVVVLHQENSGVSAARNSGLEKCSGKFIGFVDSDDVLETDMYEILVNNAIKSESDISVCSIMRIYKNSVKNKNNDNGITLYDTDQGLLAVLTGLFDMSANNKIFKSEIAKSIEFEGGFKEDFLFNIKAFLLSQKSVFQNTSRYIYMLRENSVSVKKFNERDMEGLIVDNKIMDLVSERNKTVFEEAQINYFVQNLSTLNLILLDSRDQYHDDFNIITGNLTRYSFLIKESRRLRMKHRLAYYLIWLSPSFYKFLLRIYIVFIPSEVGIRDK